MPRKKQHLLTILFCLCFSLQAVAAQREGGRLDPAQVKRIAPVTAQSASGFLPADDFAGLNLTDDQKAKIEEIHRKMNSNRDTVAKAENLNTDAKDAMIQGYSRIERSQVFEVLTPDQRKVVMQRVHARQEATAAGKRPLPLPSK